MFLWKNKKRKTFLDISLFGNYMYGARLCKQPRSRSVCISPLYNQCPWIVIQELFKANIWLFFVAFFFFSRIFSKNWGWNSIDSFILQSRKKTLWNSVQPDEKVYNCPLHQGLHCLSLPFRYLFCFSTTLTFVFNFSIKPLFETINSLKFKDGQLHLIYSGLKELKEM